MQSKLIVFGFIFLFAGLTNILAQKSGDSYLSPNDSSANSYIPTDVYKYNKMSEVIQTSGKSYNGKQLQQMAARDINQIANTVPGVQYRAGEQVIIRGASSGTAYFVDGIRVYGALPIITK